MVEPPQRGAHPDPGAAQTATERGTLGPMRDDGLAASPLRDRARTEVGPRLAGADECL